MPDLLKDIHVQYQSYGALSFSFIDYVNHGLFQQLDGHDYGLSFDYIDPKNYMDRLKQIPKYVPLSSNDEFMMFDWSQTFTDEYKGETHIWIAPNTDHTFFSGEFNLISSIGTFSRYLIFN